MLLETTHVQSKMLMAQNEAIQPIVSVLPENEIGLIVLPSIGPISVLSHLPFHQLARKSLDFLMVFCTW